MVTTRRSARDGLEAAIKYLGRPEGRIVKTTTMRLLATSGMLAAAALIGAGSASAQRTCGWYAIGGCFQQESDADSRADDIGGHTVDTYDISGFNPGWYCAVDGPYRRKDDADAARRDFVNQGVRDAYVKKGGC